MGSRRVPDGQPSIDIEADFYTEVDPAVQRAIRTTVQAMLDRLPAPEINYGRTESKTSTMKWLFGCCVSGMLGISAGIVASYWRMNTDVSTLKAQVADLREEVSRIYHIVEPHYRGASSYASDQPKP